MREKGGRRWTSARMLAKYLRHGDRMVKDCDEKKMDEGDDGGKIKDGRYRTREAERERTLGQDER